MSELAGDRSLFERALQLLEEYRKDPLISADRMLLSIEAQLRYLLDVCDKRASPDRLGGINIGVTAARFWGWGAPAADELETALHQCQRAVEQTQ